MTVRASSVAPAGSITGRLAAPASGLRLLAALFVTVLTAAASQASVPLPFTPVPFTLQPMVVLLGGAVLGARLGAGSQILYLMLGVAGAPVFAFAPDLPQGLLRLVGPSGGYLMAYPLAAFIVGTLAGYGWTRRFRTAVFAIAAGLAVVFGGGIAWLARDFGLQGALAIGFYPFVLADALKVVVAAAVVPGASKLLNRA